MDIIYILIPLSLILALAGLTAFWLSLRAGQFDDLDTPQNRILFDDKHAPQVGESPTNSPNLSQKRSSKE